MKDSFLEPRYVCARCDVLTHKKKRNSARSRSDNVEVCGSGHVVIGVRIVQCHHAIMDNVHFWSQFQLVTCSQFPLVVMLYELIVTFSL